MSSELFRIASVEEDKKYGITRTVRFMQAGTGVVVNTSTSLKDLTGRYSISESSVFVPNVIIGESIEAQSDDSNQKVYLRLFVNF